MLWLIAVYVLALFVVAAALQHELEAKPKATAAVILLYPLLPVAAVALAARLIA
jgi:hypothetical protein